MRTRIKYTNNPYDNTLSTDWFTVGPNLVIKGIIYSDISSSITDMNNNILELFLSNNKREAKRKVRAALIRHGVKFEGEIRSY